MVACLAEVEIGWNDEAAPHRRARQVSFIMVRLWMTKRAADLQHRKVRTKCLLQRPRSPQRLVDVQFGKSKTHFLTAKPGDSVGIFDSISNILNWEVISSPPIMIEGVVCPP